jgi:hypothetical protein
MTVDYQRPEPTGTLTRSLHIGSDLPALKTSLTNRGRHRRRQKIGMSMALIVLAAWMISSFWVTVQIRSPRQPFGAPTANQVWVKSPQAGDRAFFRLRLPIAVIRPSSVTLWVEGSQLVTTYVDGNQATQSLNAPNNNIDSAADLPKLVQTIDIRPLITRGMNVIGLEVVTHNNQAPAFRARLEVRTGSDVEIYGVSPSNWQSTTNAARTGQQLPQSGAFSKPNLDDGDWSAAVAAAARPGTATVTVPPDAYTQPAAAPALTSSFGAQSLIASTTVTFPPGCTEGWLRVAATGTYTVSLDGRAIANGSAGTSSSILPLSIYDLCPVAHPGVHVLTVSVSASRRPIAYLDGYVRGGSQAVSFSTGRGWYAGYRGSDPGQQSAIGTMNAPETELRVLFARVPAATSIPAGPVYEDQLVLTMELLLVAALSVIIAVSCGVSPARAINSTLCGVLPAVGAFLLLTETRHIVYVQQPFPSTPFMLAIVLGLAGLGVFTTTAWIVWQQHQTMIRTTTKAPWMAEATTPPRRTWLTRNWYGPAVGVFAAGWGLVQSYHIMFNPLWQDELSSLAAAQGMRAHLIPQWPSGFDYWKSELYTALIAVIGGVTHDDPTVLREVSVLWFVATILIFGLMLAPLVLKGRRVYQLVVTIVFATAPFEMGHAQDIRMYQMLQFVVILVSVLLLKALRDPSTRRVAWLMAAVVAMYLTHEESFGVLLVIPLALFCSSGLAWTRNWRWWVFGSGAVAVICVQLALAKFTHPPIFGIDPSGGPLVEWSPKPFFYISNFFFTNPDYGASITVVSSLAVVGMVVGFFRRDAIRLFLAAFWLVPSVVVSLVLLTKDTRYVFLCLPFVFALGACGAVDIFDAVRRVVVRTPSPQSTRLHQGFVEILAGLSTVAIMLSLIGGLNDYGTLTGTLFHANVSQRRLDYPTAVSYVKAHMQPGDIVIAASSANLVGYNLGRPPNYWIPPHRTETLLYVFEKNDQAVDTQYGIPTILNAFDFEHALNGSHRVWLVGEDSVIRSLLPSMRSIVQTRFTLQEDGGFVSVFLATNG